MCLQGRGRGGSAAVGDVEMDEAMDHSFAVAAVREHARIGGVSSCTSGCTWNQKLRRREIVTACFNWSGRQDSNLRPPAPHASALPGCATPRPRDRMIAQKGLENLTAAILSGEES